MYFKDSEDDEFTAVVQLPPEKRVKMMSEARVADEDPQEATKECSEADEEPKSETEGSDYPTSEESDSE